MCKDHYDESYAEPSGLDEEYYHQLGVEAEFERFCAMMYAIDNSTIPDTLET